MVWPGYLLPLSASCEYSFMCVSVFASSSNISTLYCNHYSRIYLYFLGMQKKQLINTFHFVYVVVDICYFIAPLVYIILLYLVLYLYVYCLSIVSILS